MSERASDLTGLIVLTWLACAFLGAVIAQQKQAGIAGLFLGLIFGPLGVLAAFALDWRLQCYKCLGRLEGRASVCPHCRTELGWVWCPQTARWTVTTPEAAVGRDSEAEVRGQDWREKHKGLRRAEALKD